MSSHERVNVITHHLSPGNRIVQTSGNVSGQTMVIVTLIPLNFVLVFFSKFQSINPSLNCKAFGYEGGGELSSDFQTCMIKWTNPLLI